MADLDKPMSVLELQDGQSLSFRVVRFELGTATIKPAHAPDGKLVQVLRVHVRPQDKPAFPHYWDITSTRLYAQLLPQLRVESLFSRLFTITARGIPPKRNFTLEVRPA